MLPQQVASRAKQILLPGISSDKYGRRQFGIRHSDDQVLFRPRHGIKGCLVGNVVEFQGICRDFYFKSPVRPGNGSYTQFGNADLYIFNGLAPRVDDSSLNRNRLLSPQGERQKQNDQQQFNSHSIQNSRLG